jgi:hypothetical protein
VNYRFVIIPGLGSLTGVRPEWCGRLQAVLLEAFPEAVVWQERYDTTDLPERLLAAQGIDPGRQTVLIGHSNGAACCVWVVDHARRKTLPLRVHFLFLLDVVTDLVRHGPLAELPESIVDHATRVYQTADPCVRSNEVFFDGPRHVVNVPMSSLRLPLADHGQVSTAEPVHHFIVEQLQGVEE